MVGAADILVGRCGCGCQVSGLFFAVAPCGIALVLLRRREGVLPALVGMSITCLPWYAKNAVLTGNPVYPLAYSLFGGKGLDAATAVQWTAAHRVSVEDGSAYSLTALAKSIVAVGRIFGVRAACTNRAGHLWCVCNRHGSKRADQVACNDSQRNESVAHECADFVCLVVEHCCHSGGWPRIASIAFGCQRCRFGPSWPDSGCRCFLSRCHCELRLRSSSRESAMV